MPGFQNPELKMGEELNGEAQAIFNEGSEAGETATKYVRLTVLFALVWLRPVNASDSGQFGSARMCSRSPC